MVTSSTRYFRALSRGIIAESKTHYFSRKIPENPDKAEDSISKTENELFQGRRFQTVMQTQ